MHLPLPVSDISLAFSPHLIFIPPITSGMKHCCICSEQESLQLAILRIWLGIEKTGRRHSRSIIKAWEMLQQWNAKGSCTEGTALMPLEAQGMGSGSDVSSHGSSHMTLQSPCTHLSSSLHIRHPLISCTHPSQPGAPAGALSGWFFGCLFG